MISAQNLPKPGGAKEIIDPYVKIELFGVHDDKKVFKTKVVNDNGKKYVQPLIIPITTLLVTEPVLVLSTYINVQQLSYVVRWA